MAWWVHRPGARHQPLSKALDEGIMRGLSGKVVIVTGGGLGIGAATCRRLAEEGCRVAVTDIKEDEARAVADDIARNGGEAAFFPLDVADEANVSETLRKVRDRWGRMDSLVNNAGIAGANKPVHEYGQEEWDQVMRVNVTGVFLMTKHSVPHLKEAGGGSIVNLSSIYGIISAQDIPAYHASKGAVREMTKTDALFYAKDGIRVNSVHPGFIWTPLVEDLAKRTGPSVEEFRAGLDALHPIGHVGEPDDIAAGIAFLVSEDAKFMTGSELVMDGGYIAR
jgi:NAD(P)-dependent dehydrogenase (short-subunit alcohol dehydrogenase family)